VCASREVRWLIMVWWQADKLSLLQVGAAASAMYCIAKSGAAELHTAFRLWSQ